MKQMFACSIEIVKRRYIRTIVLTLRSVGVLSKWWIRCSLRSVRKETLCRRGMLKASTWWLEA